MLAEPSWVGDEGGGVQRESVHKVRRFSSVEAVYGIDHCMVYGIYMYVRWAACPNVV
jgi:hypothetical protein